jgi:crotonobetainyl-CoA hydratase
MISFLISTWQKVMPRHFPLPRGAGRRRYLPDSASARQAELAPAGALLSLTGLARQAKDAAASIAQEQQESAPVTAPVRVERQDAIWEITLDRPKANAINAATSRALGEAFLGFRDDAAARVAILTGGGEKFFSAGWDLKDAASGSEADHGPTGFAGLPEIFDLNKPVIAAINGMAVGGGFELALACDLIVAAEGVEFFLPEASIGVIPDGGGVLRLPRRLPLGIAMEMMLTGKRLSAVDALRFGLVNQIAPRDRLMSEARAMASRIVAAAPLSVMAIKAVVARTYGLPVEEGHKLMRSAAIEVYERMKKSPDYFEGAKAFSEKRAPVWSGR